MKKIIFLIIFNLPLVLLAQSSITIGIGATLTVGTGADVCAGSKTVLGAITGDGTWCTTLPLPVELTSFTAELRMGNVELSWATATEVNNYGFEIEQAKGSRQEATVWERIAFVQGHGNSNSPKSYSFTVNLDLALNHNLNLFQYRLKQIDFDGKYEYSKVVEVSVETPAQFKLAQNFPNPFNPTTVINYQIPAANHVTLKVYDVLGNEVASLVDEYKQAGTHNSTFNTQNLELSSGVYFYTLHAGDFRDTKNFLLIK